MIDELWIGNDDATSLAGGATQLHNTGTYALASPDGFKGLGNPDPREDRIDRPRTHGIYDLTAYYGARIFSLQGYVFGSDIEDAWDKFDILTRVMALDGDQSRMWIKRAGRSFYEFCDVTAASAMEAPLDVPTPVIPWSIDLCAQDPRLYDGGADGVTFNTASFAASASISNGGNFSSAPVIRIYGAGTDGGVQNNSLSGGSNKIQIDDVLIGGDVVEIDMLRKTVKKNGVLHPEILDMSVSSFWKLRRGTNNLAKLGGANHIEIDWYDARI